MPRVGLVGPGAIGCTVLGAVASRRDVEVIIGARGAFGRLVVDGVEPRVDEPVRVLTSPPVPGAPLDVLLLATKAHQTEGARAWMDAWAGPRTVVLVLQNGIEQIPSMRALAPEARVAPAVVSCPARRLAPGHAEVGSRVEIVVPDDAPGRVVAELFAGSYVHVVLAADWLTAAWTKLVFNAAAGGITALLRRSNEVYRDAGARDLALSLMREAALVARADGARIEDAALAPYFDRVMARAGTHVASIAADRIAGRPTEWRARNEVIVRKGAAYGIATPLHALVTTLLRLSEP